MGQSNKYMAQIMAENGDPGAARTRDNRIKRPVLYRGLRALNQWLSVAGRPIGWVIIRALSYCFINYPIVTMGQSFSLFRISNNGRILRLMQFATAKSLSRLQLICIMLIVLLSGCAQSYSRHSSQNSYLNVGDVPNPKWAELLKRQPIEEGNDRPTHKAIWTANRNCNKKTYNKHPEWFTPKEFDAAGSGDCKDYAICKYYALRKAGFSAEQLTLYVGYYKDAPSGRLEEHMILGVNLNNHEYILDNIHPYLPWATDYFYKYFRPAYRFNENGWDVQ